MRRRMKRMNIRRMRMRKKIIQRQPILVSRMKIPNQKKPTSNPHYHHQQQQHHPKKKKVTPPRQPDHLHSFLRNNTYSLSSPPSSSSAAASASSCSSHISIFIAELYGPLLPISPTTGTSANNNTTPSFPPSIFSRIPPTRHYAHQKILFTLGSRDVQPRMMKPFMK